LLRKQKERKMAPRNNSNEIKITRVYDAPVKAVWDAWTDPDQVAKWWGPRGFSITTHSKDLKAGGHWNYTMHGPDGTDYPNKTTYYTVDKFKCLVYDHGANDDQPALFRVSVFFNEENGKTHMEMTMTLPTPEAAKQTKKFIKEAGGNSTWDRLAEYLEKESTGKEKFVINRSFDVDIETMFSAWTDPKQIVQWSGPVGAQIEYIDVDVRSGGKAFYRMPMGDTIVYGNVEYLEVKPTSRLVYVQQFADEDGNLARHPLAPTWPQSMLTTILFTEEEHGQTRVTLQWEVYNQATQEEMQTFINAKSGMFKGWDGSFDKLEEYLK
jgi:uncharacterized protein YndB with AHSA1/START domain